MHHLQRVLQVSERFACRVTGQNRGTQRRPPAARTPTDPDAALRAWLRAYAKAHPRWGFRRAYHDARGDGWQDLGDAAALPVAAGTALRAVRALGSVLGRRVLVTGASGGVGGFAVQLAARAGAHVVASVGGVARGEGLRERGAAEVVVGLDGAGPLHGVIDNVGGPLLAEAFALLGDGGIALSVGKASGRATEIDFEAERLRGGNRRLEPFTIGDGLGPDLAYLVGLLAEGGLDPQVGWRGTWDRADEAIRALLGRQVRGKAVLEVLQESTRPKPTVANAPILVA